MKQNLLKSDYIILRKTPFQESSLIVSGLSPLFGRLDFLLKGARSHQAKRFPYAGLFRVLDVEFKEKTTLDHSSLFYIKSHTPLTDFDSIAGELDHYIAVCEYGAFLLKHTRPMLEMPLTYHALLCALGRLCQPGGTLFDLAAAKLVFLHESGFLPEIPGDDPERQETLQSILEYALHEGTPCPMFPENYKNKLMDWISSLCRFIEQN